MSILIACTCCQSSRTTVIDVRSRGDNAVRRRRECKDCGHRFTTVESVIAPRQGRAA